MRQDIYRDDDDDVDVEVEVEVRVLIREMKFKLTTQHSRGHTALQMWRSPLTWSLNAAMAVSTEYCW